MLFKVMMMDEDRPISGVRLVSANSEGNADGQHVAVVPAAVLDSSGTVRDGQFFEVHFTPVIRKVTFERPGNAQAEIDTIQRAGGGLRGASVALPISDPIIPRI